VLPGLAAKRKAQLAREIAKAAVRLQAIEANRAVGNFAHDARGNARLNRRFALQKRKAAKAYATYRGWNDLVRAAAPSDRSCHLDHTSWGMLTTWAACPRWKGLLRPQLQGLIKDTSVSPDTVAEAMQHLEDLPEEVDFNRAWGDAGLDGPERTCAAAGRSPLMQRDPDPGPDR
jgi:hypothetical protein